jgi:hypothetical protein
MMMTIMIKTLWRKKKKKSDRMTSTTMTTVVKKVMFKINVLSCVHLDENGLEVLHLHRRARIPVKSCQIKNDVALPVLLLL